MSAITAKASRKMKKYAVLTREPRCFLGSFDFSWEQRKLGDVVKEITRNDPESEAPIMMITANNGFIEQSERYAFNNAGESLKKYILLKKGELAYNHGASKLRPYGSCFALTTAENARIPFVYHCFSAENQNAEFMSIELNGAEIENQLRKIVSSGARMDGLLNISFDEYTSVSVILPGTEEQDRIADFFRHLDNLITLHQRKCANLCSPSQVVFSLLFVTSTFSWEQRKLGDVVQITMGQSPDGSTYSDEPSDYILVQGNADLQNGWVCPRIWTTQITKKADAGDLIMSVRAPAGAMGKTAYNAVIGRGVAAIKGNEFIYQLLVKMDMDGFWKTLSCGSTFESLNSDNIKNAEVKVPTTAEQVQIGDFFRQLDNLITLHQRECISFTGRADRLILTANKKRTTSSWEQRKAIDIADYSKGNGYSKGDLTDAGTPIILYGRLYTKYQFAISEVDTFAFPRNGAVYSQGNEVIVPASGETAEDIARASAVEKSGVLLGGDLNILRPFDFINPLFLALAISNGEPQKELAKKAQGKSVVHIHNTDIQEVTIAYPSRTEQDRIVSVFRQLDNLITLHQRKFEKLTNVKKSMLEKMFPQNGSSYPEIRFKGFTDPWEQRKLGELALFNPKDELPQTFEYVDLESVVGTEMLSHRTEVKSSAPSRAQRLAHTGDLFYQTVRPYQKNNYLFEKPDNNYVFSTGYAQMRPYVDGYFLLSLVQSERFVKVVLDNCTGTSYPAINANDLAEIEVAAPSDESEAQKIGAIFRSIDNLITLHQRKPNIYTGGYYAE